MKNQKATLSRICPQGHRYTKRSDCSVCPICEKQYKPTDGWLAVLSAPARRAMQQHTINTLQQLSKYSESEVASWHGVGPKALQMLNSALQNSGLRFKPTA